MTNSRIDYWRVVELRPVSPASSQERLIATDDSKELCEQAARRRLHLSDADPWPEGIKLEAVLLP